jgi:uncharacterized membrane protein SpoIIM required for sporulation/ABC-type transport system involved in multi-copper enzyme maturation permease subunit
MLRQIIDQLSMAWLVARRELRDQFRDWRVIVPMVFLTIFFPFLMNATAKAALDFTMRYGTPIIAERLVPFFLMVVGFFPITVSLVIGLEAFVGEKERGTIEPLLSSPLKDWQLYLGKLVAATSVPLITSYLGIAVYCILLGVRGIPFPDPIILLQTIVLTSVQATLMVSGAIVISTQATSVRGANLLSSFVVIPMAILIQGESILMFWGNNLVLWLAVLSVTILAALLIRLGIAHFQREALLGREIDVLNLRWMARTFWKRFKGDAPSLFGWYRGELRSTLRRQRTPILLVFLLGVLTSVGGYLWLTSHPSTLQSITSSPEIRDALGVGSGVSFSSGATMFYIFGNNIRAVLVIMLLGIVSFGVLGLMAYTVNTGLIGLVLALVGLSGLDPLQVTLSGILPHGIFEIPALILSSAAVLQIGAVLVTPNSQRTLGEVLIEALADWAKIGIGLVVPLLAIAAAVEAWITPVLLQQVLSSLP